MDVMGRVVKEPCARSTSTDISARTAAVNGNDLTRMTRMTRSYSGSREGLPAAAAGVGARRVRPGTFQHQEGQSRCSGPDQRL
jgi:hypothetical protein